MNSKTSSRRAHGDLSVAQPDNVSSLGQTATSLAVFVAVALMLGSSGMANWALRGDTDGWQGWLAPRLGALDDALSLVGLSAPRRTLTRHTAGWVASLAEALAPDGQLAALEVAAAQVAEQGAIDAATVAAPSAPSDDVSVVAARARPPAATAAAAATATAMPPGDAKATPAPANPPAQATPTVLLAGDSLMAVGLAPGLLRVIGKDPEFTLARGYRSATGLSRPDYFDWPAAIDKLLQRHRAACVVIAIGGNDAQGFRDGKRVLRFGTKDWDDAYRKRVDAFLAKPRRHGARVLWIGVPVMRSKAFNTSMSKLNAIAQAAIAADRNAAYLSPNKAICDSKGNFSAFADDHRGRRQRLRANDGIHLTDFAGRRLAPEVRAWIAGNCLRRSRE